MVQRTHKSKNTAQHLTLLKGFLGIVHKLIISYFSKTSLDGYFNLTSDISLKSVPLVKTMEQNTEKANFSCMISPTLTKLREKGRAALFNRKSLQVGFWNIET